MAKQVIIVLQVDIVLGHLPLAHKECIVLLLGSKGTRVKLSEGVCTREVLEGHHLRGKGGSSCLLVYK